MRHLLSRDLVKTNLHSSALALHTHTPKQAHSDSWKVRHDLPGTRKLPGVSVNSCRCDSCCEDIDVFTWSHSAVLSSSWGQTRKSLHVKVTGRLGLVELKLMLDRISRKKT